MLSTNSWITTALIIEKATGFNANIRAGRMDRRAAPPIVVIPAWGKPVTEWNPAVPPHADFIRLHQFLLPVSIWEACGSQMLYFLGERGGSLVPVHHRQERPPPSSPPALFLAPDPAVKGQSLFCCPPCYLPFLPAKIPRWPPSEWLLSAELASSHANAS